MSDARAQVAYFSMEIGFHPDAPTYAGGLGMLAGDTIRSGADLHVPMVAVSLLHRAGYFFQRLSPDGRQTEEPVRWVVEDLLQEVEGRIAITIESRQVEVRAWRYDVTGADGFAVPIFLLDTDLPDNGDWDRRLTHYLYGGDEHYRLCQEVVLGIGGVRMLRALGYAGIRRFHMNEGHAALLTLELLREHGEREGRAKVTSEDLEAVRSQCVFTTHTPVPSGHDRFPRELASRVIGSLDACGLTESLCHEGRLNMTYLALSLSHYVNGVAKSHRDVSRHLFAGYAIDAITNGVHAASWVSPGMGELFDRYVPGWRQDNFSLRSALAIPDAEVWRAHARAKASLVEYVNRQTNVGLDADLLTVGFARRAAVYKRADLIFADPDRLRRISRDVGRLQLVFAGKAHGDDEEGKRLIQRVVRAGTSLAPDVTVVYLPNYDMLLGQLLTAGVDVWLNTPRPPLEASGTSGMKAALNGVPSLSVLDGWWIEGCIEGITGWAIGADGDPSAHSPDPAVDAAALYDKLEDSVVPLYYRDRPGWAEVMRHAIALNGSFFNTQRMLLQYVMKAYYE